jgi:hypothetical protein
MNCLEFTDWLENRDIHDISEADRALRHAAGCRKCAALLRMDEKLDTLIRQAMQRVDMPDRLPDGIDLSLERVSSRSGGRKYAFYGICSAVAALMAVFFVAFLFVPRLPSIDDMAGYMVVDHTSHDDSSLTINRLEEIPLLVDHAIDHGRVQSEVPAGSVFIGGRLCPLGRDCLALHLVFIHQGKRISLYIIEEKDVTFPRSAEHYQLLHEGGENIRFWKKGKFVYGMIG